MASNPLFIAAAALDVAVRKVMHAAASTPANASDSASGSLVTFSNSSSALGSSLSACWS